MTMTSTIPQPSTTSRADWWLLLGSLIVVGLISRLAHFLRPLEGDGPVFIYMGRVVSEGGRWGQDIVDNKFPTVGLMASFCWRLFGAYWPAYVLLGAGMSAIMTLCWPGPRDETSALPPATPP